MDGAQYEQMEKDSMELMREALRATKPLASAMGDLKQIEVDIRVDVNPGLRDQATVKRNLFAP